MANTAPSQIVKIKELSPAKRALLELRLKQQNRTSDHDPIPRRDPGKPAPLSYTQELLWLQHQISPSSAYNVPRALRIQGNLDSGVLRATLCDLMSRHEVFRTRFIAVDGNPTQVIDEDFTPALEIIDLRSMPDEDREREVVRLIYERAGRLFNLAADHLLKSTLIQLSPDENVLILVTHHIASDGRSRDILFHELSELYDAHRTGRPPQLPELPIQYADFAAWQRDVFQGPALRKQMDYWKQQLSGAPALLELPLDFPRPAEQTFNGDAIRGHLLTSSELGDLRALGLEEKATLFMTTLACAKVLLYLHTGQGDILVGTPIVGRDRAETENLLGYFMNTLVLRTGVSGDMTFREVLRDVRRVTLGAFEHQNAPYVKVVTELNPERNFSYNPVFQVLFGFGQGASDSFALSNLTTTPFAIDRGLAKFDLTISTSAVESGLIAGLEYNTALFTAETISRMMGRFENLVKGVLANPDSPIAELPLLNASERKQLLTDWNNTHVAYPAAANLPELFEAQVERTPNAIALEFMGRRLSYADLNARANQLAHYLREYGVGPEVPVGVLMDRSPELIISLLGILKAGGAYVPLDEKYPLGRRLYVLKLAGAPVVVTQKSLEENLAGYEGRILSLDRVEKQIAEQISQNPAHVTGPDNLAYIMFSSGSTGLPKGISVPQSCLTHFVRAAADLYRIKPTDRVLQFASICFDTSIEEIFPCLSIGATLVIRNEAMLDTISTFWQRCDDWGISVLSLPTAFWHELARAAPDQKEPVPETLRLVVIGGEKARADSLELWQQKFGQRIQLLNTYGPTETTVVATACDITSPVSGEIPIGRPIPNVRVYLLDQFGQPVPRGVTGELYIGGDGVARGYLHDKARTEESFIPDPFTAGGRLYRTGDLGRYRPDGNIEFMGRRDDQVKLRGFRIELGEIENALMRHPEVSEVIVLAPESAGGEHRIVAYLSPAAGINLPTTDLRSYLEDQLPAFMIPNTFVVLPELPKTPGGKVDRRALPAPEWNDAAGEFVDPSTPIEESMAEIWQEVLGLGRISVHANFFELGGHSLLAIRLLSQIQHKFDTGISLAEMLKAPTVHAMARLLQRKELGQQTWSPLVPLQPLGDRPPLFCAPVGGGSAFYYFTLAAHIGGDQPLYTFEPIGMNGVDKPQETVEEMAAYYLRHLRAVQPRGPYSLCGLSFGGIVAYEMARQLKEAGEEVAILILFDTKAPGYADAPISPAAMLLRKPARAIRYTTRFHLENLSACAPGERLQYVRARMAKLRQKLVQAKGKLWNLNNENPISLELPEIFQNVKSAEARARAKYHAAGYPGYLLLLRARLQYRRSNVKPLLGWEGLADKVDVVETPGTHFSLLEEPCVRITVRHLRRALDDARGV